METKLDKNFYMNILQLDKVQDSGMKVYQDNYLYNHLDTLKLSHEVTFKILGEDNFNYFAREYIKTHFESSGDLNIYGSEFSKFLNDKRDLHQLLYLSDIAKVDYLWSNKIVGNYSVSVGIISLWLSVLNDEKIESLEINDDIAENFEITLNNNEYRLIKK